MMIDDATDRIPTAPTSQDRWVGRSTFVDNFDDFFDMDSAIFYGQFADTLKYRLKNRDIVRAVKAIRKTGYRKTPVILASIVLQLDHPNLVVLRDIFETPADIRIIQDYIDGPNLFQRIAQKETFTEVDLSNYTSQILKALAYMHERSIYHGKIHGGNVLVRVSDDIETVYLGDFAFSNLCAEEARSRLVKYSQPLCSPEILRGELFSEHSDCWQLGLLLYFCCTGRYPFVGEGKKIYRDILQARLDFDSFEWDDVSKNGQTFIADLLKLDSKQRMTVNQALSSPWIRSRVYQSETLSQAQDKIRLIWNESASTENGQDA